MKKYCIVNELKQDNVKDYINIHQNAHLTKWKTQLDALKDAGAENCTVFIYKNLAIMTYECEDIDDSFAKLGENEENNKWQEVVAPWFSGSPKFDGSQKVESLVKIFDLNQQLEGKLDKF